MVILPKESLLAGTPTILAGPTFVIRVHALDVPLHLLSTLICPRASSMGTEEGLAIGFSVLTGFPQSEMGTCLSHVLFVLWVVGKGDAACLLLCGVDGVGGLDGVGGVDLVNKFCVCVTGVGKNCPDVGGNK